MEKMTQVAKAAEARCGKDGGFLLYRQLDSTKLKAKPGKSFFDLPGWTLSPSQRNRKLGEELLP